MSNLLKVRQHPKQYLVEAFIWQTPTHGEGICSPLSIALSAC